VCRSAIIQEFLEARQYQGDASYELKFLLQGQRTVASLGCDLKNPAMDFKAIIAVSAAAVCVVASTTISSYMMIEGNIFQATSAHSILTWWLKFSRSQIFVQRWGR
jgi:hypothetical protein